MIGPQLFLAQSLWARGKNTQEIAQALNVPEHVVYNAIDSLKAVSARTPRQGNSRAVIIPIAHKESSPVSVASTLRQELENCLTTRKTENLRGGM